MAEEPYVRVLDGFVTKRIICPMENGIRQGPGTEFFDVNGQEVVLACTWKNGKKSGDGTIFDNNGQRILQGLFEDDELNGLVKLYYPSTGKIKLEGSAIDGMLRGIVQEYDELGSIEFEGEYLFGNRHGLGKLNGRNGIWVNGMERGDSMQLEPNPLNPTGAMALIEFGERGLVVYRGGYDPISFRRHGYGIEYDPLTGDMIRMCWYENGEVIRVMRLFFRGHMDEWDDNDHCVYRGFYSGDYWSGINRDLIGMEFSPEGKVKYCGTWFKGTKSDLLGNLRTEIANLRNECGELLSNGASEEVITASRAKWNRRAELGGQELKRMNDLLRALQTETKFLDSVTIQSKNTVYPWYDLNSHSIDVPASSDITVPEKIIDLRLHRLINRIVIADNCFSSVQSFVLDLMYDLQAIVVGARCFTQCTFSGQDDPDVQGPDGRITEEKRSCTFSNLPSLESIDIGHQSFADFTALEISNCSKLKSLSFGNQHLRKSSWNFYLCPGLELSGLSSLNSISFSGACAFFYSKSLVLSNLSSLKSVVMNASFVFRSAYSFVLQDLPKLNTFDISAPNCLQARQGRSPGEMTISNVPNVTNVKLGPGVVSNASFFSFKVVNRGRSVAELLYTKIISHLKQHSMYSADITEISKS